MKITCDKCKGDITKREDLVVVSYGILPIFRKYHNGCYAVTEKKTFFKGSFFQQPINSKSFKVNAFLTFFIVLALTLLAIQFATRVVFIWILITILSTLPIIYWWYFHNKVERLLK